MKTFLILLVAHLSLVQPLTSHAGVTPPSSSALSFRALESASAVSLHAPVLLAQTSIDSPIDNFKSFLFKILALIALVMCIWSGFLIHDGKLREGIYALMGAFVVMAAGLLVQALSSMTGH